MVSGLNNWHYLHLIINKEMILMSRSLHFYFVFSVLLFLAGASYFPSLEYFSINIDKVLLLIPALTSVVTMLIAWVALDSWRAQDKYNSLKDIALIIFQFREVAKSIEPIENEVKKFISDTFVDSDRIDSALDKAKFKIFSYALDYERCLVKMGGGIDWLEKYHPDIISEKFDCYFYRLERCMLIGLELEDDISIKRKDLIDYIEQGLVEIKNMLK